MKTYYIVWYFVTRHDIKQQLNTKEQISERLSVFNFIFRSNEASQED